MFKSCGIPSNINILPSVYVYNRTIELLGHNARNILRFRSFRPLKTQFTSGASHSASKFVVSRYRFGVAPDVSFPAKIQKV